MGVIKATVISILTMGLLASAAVGVLAQETGDATLEASAFRAMSGPPEDIAFDPETGVEQVTNVPWEATDPRATGLMSTLVARGGVCAEARRVIDGIVDCELPIYSISISGAQLVNDGGAWVGTLTFLDTEELDGRTRKQRRKGKGQAPINGQGGFLELTGEGGYAGLSMLATTSPKGILGVIIPTDTLPTQPQPPLASTLVDEAPRTPARPRAEIGLGALGIADGPDVSIETIGTDFDLRWVDRSDNEDGFRIYRIPVRPVCRGGMAEFHRSGAPVLVETVPPDTTSARGTFASEKETSGGKTTGSLTWKMAVSAFNEMGESMVAVMPDADVVSIEASC